MSKKFSELAEATVFDGTEQLALVNSSGVSNKALLSNIAGFISPSNIIIVNSISDFPAAVAGVITFTSADNGKLFLLNQDIVSSNRLVVEDGISVSFKSVEIKAYQYTGTGKVLTSSDFGVIIFNIIVFLAPSGGLWDLSGTGQITAVSSIFTDVSTGGTASNDFLTFLFCAFSDFGQGLVFNNNASGVAFSEGSFIGWKNEGATMLTFTGSSMGDVVMFNTGLDIAVNDTLFDFDQSLSTGNTQISVTTNTLDKNSTGTVFDPTGLDQTYANANFLGSPGLPDSQVIGSLAWAGNTTDTVITTQNVYVKLAGTTFPVENERCSQTADNELTFINNDPVSKNLRCRLDVLRGSGSGTPTFEFRVLKNGSPIQVNSLDITSKIVTNSNDSVNMVLDIPASVIDTDVFIIEGRNITNTSNILITDGTEIID